MVCSNFIVHRPSRVDDDDDDDDDDAYDYDADVAAAQDDHSYEKRYCTKHRSNLFLFGVSLFNDARA